MVSIDDYKEVKDCINKDERYSARDNGAGITWGQNAVLLYRYCYCSLIISFSL